MRTRISSKRERIHFHHHPLMPMILWDLFIHRSTKVVSIKSLKKCVHRPTLNSSSSSLSSLVCLYWLSHHSWNCLTVYTCTFTSSQPLTIAYIRLKFTIPFSSQFFFSRKYISIIRIWLNFLAYYHYQHQSYLPPNRPKWHKQASLIF